ATATNRGGPFWLWALPPMPSGRLGYAGALADLADASAEVHRPPFDLGCPGVRPPGRGRPPDPVQGGHLTEAGPAQVAPFIVVELRGDVPECLAALVRRVESVQRHCCLTTGTGQDLGCGGAVGSQSRGQCLCAPHS